jgi:hypothetical protein
VPIQRFGFFERHRLLDEVDLQVPVLISGLEVGDRNAVPDSGLRPSQGQMIGRLSERIDDQIVLPPATARSSFSGLWAAPCS